MLGEFLSAFTNLDKYSLCFWVPFWVRRLSEPLTCLMSRVSFCSAKITANICRFRCFLAEKFVVSVKFTQHLVITSLIQYSPHLIRKNLLDQSVAGLRKPEGHEDVWNLSWRKPRSEFRSTSDLPRIERSYRKKSC